MLPFLTLQSGTGRSKPNDKFRVTGRARNVAFTRPSLHPEVSLASRAGDFNAWCLGLEGKVRLAHAAFELRRPRINPRHKHLGAGRAREFLFHPLSPCDGVIDAHPCLAQLARQFAQPNRKHSVAFWTRQRWGRNLRLNGQLVGHAASLLLRIQDELLGNEIPWNIEREAKFF